MRVTKAFVRLLFVFLSTLICCIISQHAFGRESGANPLRYENIRFQKAGINEGLSQNFVASIYQDHHGFIWIGTRDGLNMYDGYSFRVFKHDPFDPFSISDNYIRAIHEDQQGRLWIGTFNGGLNVFDRQTESFIRFAHDPGKPESISSNNIQQIVCDLDGHIWIGTARSGINKLSFRDPEEFPAAHNVEVTRYTDTIGDMAIGQAEIFSLTVDRENILWAGTSRGIISKKLSDPASGFREVSYAFSDVFKREHRFWPQMSSGARAVFEDHSGRLWMASRLGLFTYDREEERFEQWQIQDTTFLISGNITATSFMNRGRQEIWMGTAHGLYIFKPETGEYMVLPGIVNDQEALNINQIICFLVDQSGTIWAGTSGSGLGLFNPYTMKFHYPNERLISQEGIAASSRNLSIRAFYETTEPFPYVWLGAAQGLFRLDRRNDTMTEIIPSRNPGHGMFSVFSIEEDQDGVLWMGSTWGLVRYDFRADSLKRFPTHLNDDDQSGEPRVSKVHISKDNIWIITPNTIALFDPGTESFEHFRYNNDVLNRFREAVYPCLYEDSKGNFWFGTHTGLHYFDVHSKELISYKNDPSLSESLPFNDVRAIIPDPDEPDKYLWLATGGGGLARFDLKKKTFIRLTEKDGLANNMVYGMLPDDETASLWLSTNLGLSRFNIKERSFVNYTVSDGLQSNEFNSGAFYKNKKGEMFFGGIRGYNSFFPSDIHHKQYAAPVVFTECKLLHGSQGQTISFANITEKKELILKHNQNNFSISFATLDYAAVHANKFAYSFTRWGEKWIQIGHNHSITFTDLKPGSYWLRVRGTNNDGVWSEHEAVMKINIARPWWNSKLSWLFYLIFLLAAVAAMRRFELSRVRLRNSMRLAEMEANKLKELDGLKSKFFTNISHEFRTPLTLIKGPLHDLIHKTEDSGERQLFIAMHKNADRLLQLINQLLDFSRLESGNYKLKAARGDICSLVKACVMSFASQAEHKKIRLLFMESSSMKDAEWHNNFYFDPDVLEKIMFNLLANALKFTPANGRITVNICPVQKKGKNTALEIIIRDTGIGIAADKLPLIYNRFYQVDDAANRVHEGTGIGLAYVKELVDAHKGQISVMSKAGRGTVFRLTFPLGHHHFSAEQLQDETEAVKSGMLPAYELSTVQINNKQLSERKPERKERPVVLLVEDHTDLRTYLGSILKQHYTILEASHGKQGMELAAEMIPDLIISDVMMPGMDGYAFCNMMKTDERTSHIPLILLTARADEKDLLHGLELGADDYLTKPFHSAELKMRVGNLIESRRKLREKFEANTLLRPSDISVTSRDRAFVEKLLKLVEANLDNEAFSVEAFAEQAGMSPSQLHRKLKALLNQSAIQFIRSVRMQRAKELIEKDAGNIAEIAYMVGFSDPGYFSKTFRKFFGKRPSDVSS